MFSNRLHVPDDVVRNVVVIPLEVCSTCVPSDIAMNLASFVVGCVLLVRAVQSIATLS